MFRNGPRVRDRLCPPMRPLPGFLQRDRLPRALLCLLRSKGFPLRVDAVNACQSRCPQRPPAETPPDALSRTLPRSSSSGRRTNTVERPDTRPGA
ncbi:hypothetical protein VTO73DRAFT_14308 [Trametes versicolor]